MPLSGRYRAAVVRRQRRLMTVARIVARGRRNWQYRSKSTRHPGNAEQLKYRAFHHADPTVQRRLLALSTAGQLWYGPSAIRWAMCSSIGWQVILRARCTLLTLAKQGNYA